MLKRVVQAYAGLGRRPRDLPPGFGHVHCPHWRNARTSPVWPLARTVSESGLAQLEAFFARHPKRHPNDDARRCYLNVLAGWGGHDVRSIAATAAAAGWRREDHGTLNVWRKPLPMALPPGAMVRFARLRRTPLHRDFMSLTRRNFKVGGAFMRELDAMFPSIARNTFEVVLYARSGKPAAAGLVTTNGAAGYLFCGSVSPRHRGKGLWYSLVAVRQRLARADGARYWVTSTFNPRIAGKADRSFKVVTFYKDATER